MSTVITANPVQMAEPPSLLSADPHGAPGRPLDTQARRDLLVDQFLRVLTKGREEYDLDDWLTTLVPAEDVGYRHDIFRDLQNPAVRDGLVAFSSGMQRLRQILSMSATLSYGWEKRRWFLQAAVDHVTMVGSLADTLGSAQLSSVGLSGLSSWVREYVASQGFETLRVEAGELAATLDAIRYRVRVHGDWVQVRPVDIAEPELAPQVLATFERFRQGAASSYLQQIRDPGAMDHVEAAIASFVARLNPEPFASLTAFCTRHRALIPPALTRAERELQFYLAHLDLMAATASFGVSWTLPDISSDHAFSIHEGVDLALALASSSPPVPGDCALAAAEGLVVITGPNQGGKTTFARMLGQLHVLAATGAPVPARTARIPLVDQVFTIFDRGENVEDQRGHLHDDLVRAQALLQQITTGSLVLLNEVYSSTTPDDARGLGKDLLTRLEHSGARTVAVTFLDELSRHSPTTVSLVAGVDPGDPTRRTYRLRRRPADGLAYARALAQQHALAPDDLRRRLAR